MMPVPSFLQVYDTFDNQLELKVQYGWDLDSEYILPDGMTHILDLLLGLYGMMSTQPLNAVQLIQNRLMNV
jgi:hypothetical protein